MSWQTAVVGAIGAAQFQQQGAIGKYNQAVANRNAQVAEQEAQRLEQQLEFDLARFDPVSYTHLTLPTSDLV